MEIDNRIFENNQDIFKNEEIFLLHYYMGRLSYSVGNIIRIENNKDILYTSKTSRGSGVGPIIDSSNFQLIGAHKGKNLNFECAIGVFLKEPILQYYKKFGLQKSYIFENELY